MRIDLAIGDSFNQHVRRTVESERGWRVEADVADACFSRGRAAEKRDPERHSKHTPVFPTSRRHLSHRLLRDSPDDPPSRWASCKKGERKISEIFQIMQHVWADGWTALGMQHGSVRLTLCLHFRQASSQSTWRWAV